MEPSSGQGRLTSQEYRLKYFLPAQGNDTTVISRAQLAYEIKSGNISLYYCSDLKCGYPVYMHVLKYLCFDCINIEFPVNSACIHFQPKKFGKGVF